MVSNRFYNLRLVPFVVVGLAVLFVLAYAKPAPAEVILKWATHWPAGHKMSQVIEQPFMKMVEKATNGRVKFKYFPGQQLGKMTTNLEMLKHGVCDIAYCVPPVYSGKLPLNQVTFLPFITSRMTPAQLFEFNRNLTNVTDLQKEFKPYNCFPLYYWVMEPTAIWTKEPLTSLNEVNKAAPKIRSPGGFTDAYLSAIGCVPVAVNDPEMYTSLQTGVIDGVDHYPSSFLSWKLHEVCSNALTLNKTKYPSSVLRPSGWELISYKTWNKISKKDQDIILKICLEHESTMASNADKIEAASINRLKSLGMKFHYLSEQESVRWSRLVLPMWNKWANKMGDPGRRVLEKAKTIVDKMGCQVIAE